MSDRADREGVDEVRAYDANADDASDVDTSNVRAGDASTDHAGRSVNNDLNNKSPDEIRHDIEETREKLSEDLDELSYRLSPERAKEEVRERLEDVQEVVVQGARDLADTVLSRAGETFRSFEGRGQTLVDEVEGRPVASSLVAAGVVGAGVGWVLWQQMSGERPQRRSYDDLNRDYGNRDYSVRRTTYRSPAANSPVVSSRDNRSQKDFETETTEAQTPFWSPRTDAAAEARARVQRARNEGGGLQTFVKDNAVALGIGATVAGVAAAFFALRDRETSPRRALPPPRASTPEGRYRGQGGSSTRTGTRTDTATYSADADEKYFEQHFETHYEGVSGSFNDYRAAYLFGTSLSEDERYLDLPWDEVEPEAKRRWEEEYIDPWDTRKEAVRYGYDRGKMNA